MHLSGGEHEVISTDSVGIARAVGDLDYPPGTVEDAFSGKESAEDAASARLARREEHPPKRLLPRRSRRSRRSDNRRRDSNREHRAEAP
jgi:hypothetical protein